MATKHIDVRARVTLKHDIEKNWITAGNNGFCPLAGEVIIYDIEEGVCSQLRYKVGRKNKDGQLVNINDLPFITNIHIGETEPVDAPIGYMWLNGSILQIKTSAETWTFIGGSVEDLVGRPCGNEHGEIFNDYETNEAYGEYSHAEGNHTKATGWAAHTEGKDTQANGHFAHSEGDHTQANEKAAHAEGAFTVAGGPCTHTEGLGTAAYGFGAHSEGVSDALVEDCVPDVRDATQDELIEAWNENHFSLALGHAAHEEGNGSFALEDVTHAEGEYTLAKARGSHTEGFGAIASGSYQHVQGKFNVEDKDNKFAHIVGNGEDDNSRSNAHTVDWQGNAWFAGEIKIGGESQDDPIAKSIAVMDTLSEVVEDNALFVFDTKTKSFKYSGFTLESFKEMIVAEIMNKLNTLNN